MAMAEVVTLAVVQRGEWIPQMRRLLSGTLPPAGLAQVASGLALVGEVDAVRPFLQRLEALDTNDPNQIQPGLVARALVAVADGRAQDGADRLEAYLAQYPRALELHYYLGLVHERAGKRDDAIAQYRKAVQARNVLGPNPAVMAARLALGQLLKQQGDMAGANEQFDTLERQWAGADPDFAMLQAIKAAR